jgi:alkylation response protein AidB-like acyl-CoA dehydrogenase
VDEVRAALGECYKFATQVLGPLNAIGDVTGCKIVDGQVVTPEGFKSAWKQLAETGWMAVGADPEHGGAGAPSTVQAVISELLDGANAAFTIYPGLGPLAPPSSSTPSAPTSSAAPFAPACSPPSGAARCA